MAETLFFVTFIIWLRILLPIMVLEFHGTYIEKNWGDRRIPHRKPLRYKWLYKLILCFAYFSQMFGVKATIIGFESISEGLASYELALYVITWFLYLNTDIIYCIRKCHRNLKNKLKVGKDYVYISPDRYENTLVSFLLTFCMLCMLLSIILNLNHIYNSFNKMFWLCLCVAHFILSIVDGFQYTYGLTKYSNGIVVCHIRQYKSVTEYKQVIVKNSKHGIDFYLENQYLFSTQICDEQKEKLSDWFTVELVE